MVAVISLLLPTRSHWGIVAAVPALAVACTFPDYAIDLRVVGGSAGDVTLPGGAGAGASIAGGGSPSVDTEAGSSSVGLAGAPADPPCMRTYPTTLPGLTSRYKEAAVGLSWANAERDCETDGGHLIVVDDAAENEWMKWIAATSMTGDTSTSQQAWIGLGDSATEETFFWVTGAPLTLAPWGNGEPNDKNDNEDCVQIGASGSWNDDSCNELLVYACECDGTPSAGLWCDSQATETCGDCDSPCPPEQTCVASKCQ